MRRAREKRPRTYGTYVQQERLTPRERERDRAQQSSRKQAYSSTYPPTTPPTGQLLARPTAFTNPVMSKPHDARLKPQLAKKEDRTTALFSWLARKNETGTLPFNRRESSTAAPHTVAEQLASRDKFNTPHPLRLSSGTWTPFGGYSSTLTFPKT